MLLRFSLSAAGALLLAAGAQAQSNASYLPVPGVKSAGTLHMSTGKLVPGNPITKGVYETLYRNDCSGGVYSNGITANGIPSRYHDAGTLPSTTSPFVSQPPVQTPGSTDYMDTEFPGLADSYEINGFSFSYCTQVLPRLWWEITFYDCYVECSDISSSPPTPAAGFIAPNLPGTQTVGATACWTITVNLFNTTLAFPLMADCDGTWNDTDSNDTFGFALGLYNGSPTNIWTSPILEGDPEGRRGGGPGGTGCAIGSNTVFFQSTTYLGTSAEGSGLDALDRFAKSEWAGGVGPWVHNGCYWFGNYDTGNPMGNVTFIIWGDADPVPDDPGTPFGGGGVDINNCPCANNNTRVLPDIGGCAMSLTADPLQIGCNLSATGVAVASTDPAVDTVVLMAKDAKDNTNGLFFKGNDPFLPGIPLGSAPNGLLQVVTKIKRFGALVVAGGMADSSGYARTLSDLSDASAGDTRHYQFWYRTPKKSGPCTNPSPGGSNTSNGYTIQWM